MDKDARIFVAGHQGMVGSAVSRLLKVRGFTQVIERSRKQLDLTDAAAVRAFYREARPHYVVMAAAKVGGIHANNTYPADFLYQNLAIAQHTIHEAWQAGVQRLLFLGSSCIYPRMSPQPIKEEYLLHGPLEKTNEAYAIAKITGLKLCQYYRQQYGVCFHSAMPTNLYGPGDNYHPQHSHVLPALIRRFHEAKQQNLPTVTVWGSGTPKREFLHVDDLAQAVLHLLQLEDPPDLVNVGCGEDISIRDLAALVAERIGYRGSIAFDASKPDGTPRKLLDISLLQDSGWIPTIELPAGIDNAYQDFLQALKQNTLRSS